MQRQRCRQNNGHAPDMTASLRSVVENELNCDRLHRNIIGRLDDMIELLSRHPGSNLTCKMDQLLDAMLEHVGPENNYLELVESPHARGHGLWHRFICSKAARLRYHFSIGGEVLPRELESLRLLWLEHIAMHGRALENAVTPQADGKP